MGVAGHNCYVKEEGAWRFMDFDETLVKEAEEEIGLTISICNTTEKEFIASLKTLKDEAVAYVFEKFHYLVKPNNEWVGLAFIATPITDVKFNDKEVIDFKWMTPAKLKDYLKNNDNYCAPLPLVLEKAEKFRQKIGI